MLSVPNIIVQIVHISGPLKGEIQEISAPEIVIGRRLTCQVQLPKNLTIISRRHATIIREGNRFRLIDESANGTYLNGKRVSETHLKDGDVIMLAEDGPKMSFLTKIGPAIDSNQTEPEIDSRPPTPGNIMPSLPQQSPSPSWMTSDSHSPGSPQPTPQKIKAPLVIQYGPTLLSYNELPITLGSGADCNFIMNHPAVQPRHAQIFYSEDKYWIKDLTGMQSILIHDTPIDNPVMLRPDDILTLGNGGPAFRFLGSGRLAEIEQTNSLKAADQVEEKSKIAGLGDSNAKSKKKPALLFKKLFSG